jgi:hypothetical protein
MKRFINWLLRRKPAVDPEMVRVRVLKPFTVGGSPVTMYEPWMSDGCLFDKKLADQLVASGYVEILEDQ